MSIRGYSLGHIKLAIEVEESGLCTPDYLDQKAARLDKNYLTDERFQESVERARHFIFDELAMLEPKVRKERLMAHLSNFTTDEDEKKELYEKVIDTMKV